MPKSPTIAFVSLGCSKNLVDSERMLGLLAQDGFTVGAAVDGSDLVVVNTCGFIDAARQESMGVIEEMLERKRTGSVKGVIVAGCLAERGREELLEQFPEVDQVVGVYGREEIARLAERVLGGLNEQRTLFRPAPIQAQDDRARLRMTPRHFAYLKVSEGCDRFCTFCAIPFMRGKHVSKPLEMVVDEARELVADGVRELVLVAQDMTYYGLDLYGRPRLAELLEALHEVDGLDWIRILYCYPQYFTDELYDVLGQGRKIIPYLDMPLQHINDRLLKLMNRRHTRSESEAIIERLRATIPGLVLRTTFIVGFPGETEAEFDELLGFVETTKFERLGVFCYSFEPDTPAALLRGHVDDAVKQDRQARIMAAQQPIAFGFNERLVGRELDVIIDGRSPEDRGSWLGRTYADAPDVDGAVRLRGANLASGEIVRCEIVESMGYDLVGRPVETPGVVKRARPKPRRKPRSGLVVLDEP